MTNSNSGADPNCGNPDCPFCPPITNTSAITPEVRQIADILWQFHNDRLDDPSISEMKPYIDPILALLNEAELDGVRKYIEWGYGERCATKDTDDFPELKGEVQGRCPACEEWEHYDEYATEVGSEDKTSEEHHA